MSIIVVRIILKKKDFEKIFNNRNDKQISINDNIHYDPKKWIVDGAIYTIYNGDKISINKYTTSTKWPSNTCIKCWHCTMNFDSIPIGLPYSIKEIKEKIIYYVKGCFCSFPCVMAYNLTHENNCIKHENYIYMLYREFGGKGMITKAPPHVFLIEYGGILSQNQYKKMISKSSNIITSAITFQSMISTLPQYYITSHK